MDARYHMLHAPPQFIRQREQDGIHHMIPALGGVAGALVLLNSAGFIIISAAAIWYAADDIDSQELMSGIKTMKHSIMYAYGSLAALLIPVIIEHIYVFNILGNAVIFRRHYRPRIEWRRCFQILLAFYWGFVIAEVICLGAAINSIHHRESPHHAVSLSLAFDYFLFPLVIYLHRMAVHIHSVISGRRWLTDLHHSTVESEQYDKCVICIEALTDGEIVRQLPCHHTFHKDCIDEWLVEERWCPLCKRAI